MSDTDVAILLLYIAAVVFLPMVVGSMIASSRGRSVWAGVLLGAVLSWVGVAACLFLPRGRRRYMRRY